MKSIGLRNCVIELSHLLAQVISSLTASLIYDGTLNEHVNEVHTNWYLTRAFILCFAATRRHHSGESVSWTAELRARASQLLTDGISAFPWSAARECR